MTNIVSLISLDRTAALFKLGQSVVSKDGRYRGAVRKRIFKLSDDGAPQLSRCEVQRFDGKGAVDLFADQLIALDPQYIPAATALPQGVA
jgi:hypothetical protein